METRRQRIAIRVFVVTVVVGVPALIALGGWRGNPDLATNVILGVIAFFAAVILVERLAIWLGKGDP